MFTTHLPCAHCAAVSASDGITHGYHPPDVREFYEPQGADQIVSAERVFLVAGVSATDAIWPRRRRAPRTAPISASRGERASNRNAVTASVADTHLRLRVEDAAFPRCGV